MKYRKDIVYNAGLIEIEKQWLMALKQNLIKCMKNKKMAIKDLATLTGISEPTLKRLRSQSDANPTLDVLTRIASALCVSVNDLIQEECQTSVFYQGDTIEFTDTLDEFMILFTKKTFSFQAGSKAVFKKHAPGKPVTKYILNADGKLFEKISDEKWLFMDELHNNYSLNENVVFASILKEIYEVNYV